MKQKLPKSKHVGMAAVTPAMIVPAVSNSNQKVIEAPPYRGPHFSVEPKFGRLKRKALRLFIREQKAAMKRSMDGPPVRLIADNGEISLRSFYSFYSHENRSANGERA